MMHDILARIGTTPLKKLMETAGRAENVRCSEEGKANITTFLYVISDLLYQLAAPSDTIESRGADSDIDHERHATIQPL
jgi:hypothetical protein